MKASWNILYYGRMRLHNPPSVLKVDSYTPDFLKLVARSLLKRIKDILNYSLTTLLCIGTVLFFILSLFLFILSLPAREVAAEGVTEPTSSLPTVMASSDLPLEMHVASNGLIVLRNAQVMEVNGTTILVGGTLGSVNVKWTVHTNADTYGPHVFGTRFLSRSGETLSLRDLHAGDFVTVTGMLDGIMQELVLKADVVRSVD